MRNVECGTTRNVQTNRQTTPNLEGPLTPLSSVQVIRSQNYRRYVYAQHSSGRGDPKGPNNKKRNRGLDHHQVISCAVLQ
jgi:hypothetical protein